MGLFRIFGHEFSQVEQYFPNFSQLWGGSLLPQYVPNRSSCRSDNVANFFIPKTNFILQNRVKSCLLFNVYVYKIGRL